MVSDARTKFDAMVAGIAAVITFLLSYQLKQRKNIITCNVVSRCLYIVQYLLLGAWVGMVMDLIGSIRNIVFTLNVKNNKSNKWWIIFFSIITLIAGVLTIIFTWDKSIGYASNWSNNPNVVLIIAISISIISIVAKLLTTIAYGFKNPHLIRMINLPSNACWVVYNVVAFSIAGVINDLMCLLSIIVAEIRFRKQDTPDPLKENNDDEFIEIQVDEIK